MKHDETSVELERIKAESAAWVAEHERGLTAEEQDRFFEWLAADPRHGEWLRRHHRGLQQLKGLAQWRPEHGSEPNPDLLASPATARKRLAWIVPLALAAAAAIAIAFLMWKPAGIIESPDIAQLRKVLEDGSTIDLERGAEVAVRYTAERRDVQLVKGEASFHVAKNATRPFVVAAAGVSVRAVGTAFNVKLSGSEVAVVVTEGRVQVEQPKPDGAHPIPILEAGQQAVLAVEGTSAPRIQPVAAEELARVMSRQPRFVEFNDAPLSQVVAEFNAQNDVKIVIVDRELAAMPVGASLRIDNVDGFVRIVEANFDARAERGNGVIVLGRK